MDNELKLIFTLVICAVPAYVLGSVNGAIIASISIYRKDIREYGSGNPGLTNFYRVFGKGGAILVVLIDAAKSLAPVLLGGYLFGRYFDMQLFGREITGLFVLIGHCFPVFYKFHGGKGIMAAGTILIVVDWRLAIISWGLFIVITAATKLVSLASIIGVAAFPVFQIVFRLGGAREYIVAIVCAALVIARHHANVGRLLRGEEQKMDFSHSDNRGSET